MFTHTAEELIQIRALVPGTVLVHDKTRGRGLVAFLYWTATGHLRLEHLDGKRPGRLSTCNLANFNPVSLRFIMKTPEDEAKWRSLSASNKLTAWEEGAKSADYDWSIPTYDDGPDLFDYPKDVAESALFRAMGTDCYRLMCHFTTHEPGGGELAEGSSNIGRGSALFGIKLLGATKRLSTFQRTVKQAMQCAADGRISLMFIFATMATMRGWRTDGFKNVPPDLVEFYANFYWSLKTETWFESKAAFDRFGKILLDPQLHPAHPDYQHAPRFSGAVKATNNGIAQLAR